MSMQWSRKNFASKEGRLMTFTGLGLIVLGVITLWLTENETVSVLLIVAGLGAMGLKDPRGGTPGHAATVILWMVMLLTGSVLMTGCVTYNKCVEKFGENTPKPITLRDTIKVQVPIPGQSLEGTAPCPDTEVTGNRSPVTSDTTTQVSDNGKAQIKFWRDQYNALRYRLECKDSIVEVEVPVEIQGDCPDVVTLDPKNASGWPRFVAYYRVFSGWVLLVGLVALMIYIRLKRKPVMYVEKDNS